MATVAKRPGRPKGTTKVAILANESRRKATAFKAIADPTRLRIVEILSNGEQNVMSLTAEINTSQANVSHNLGKMLALGIVEKERRGKNVFYSLTEDGESLSNAIQSLS